MKGAELHILLKKALLLFTSTAAPSLIVKNSCISLSFQVDIFLGILYVYSSLLHPETFVFFQFIGCFSFDVYNQHWTHVYEHTHTHTQTQLGWAGGHGTGCRFHAPQHFTGTFCRSLTPAGRVDRKDRCGRVCGGAAPSLSLESVHVRPRSCDIISELLTTHNGYAFFHTKHLQSWFLK